MSACVRGDVCIGKVNEDVCVCVSACVRGDVCMYVHMQI